MNKIIKHIFLGLFILLTISCKTQQMNSEESFETLVYSQYGPEMEATERIIENKSDFEEIYKKVYENIMPIPEMPEVNFNEKSVIFIHFGSYSYGGISYEVKEIVQNEGQLDITLIQDMPKRGEPALSVMTNPFMLIEIPKITPQPTNINIIKVDKENLK